MELKPSEAQVRTIDGLIDGTITIDTAHKTTMRVLQEREWVDATGTVTQAGLSHTTHPVQTVRVVVLGKPVTYTHQRYRNGNKEDGVERITYNLPKGTEILVTFVQGSKNLRHRTVQGLIQTTDEPIWVTLYYASHMTFVERLMPDMGAIKNAASD